MMQYYAKKTNKCLKYDSKKSSYGEIFSAKYCVSRFNIICEKNVLR